MHSDARLTARTSTLALGAHPVDGRGAASSAATAAAHAAPSPRVDREFNFPDFPIKLERHPAIEQRDAKDARAKASHPVSVITDYFIEPANGSAAEQAAVGAALREFLMDKENKGAEYVLELGADVRGAYAGLIEPRSKYENSFVEGGSWARGDVNRNAWTKIPCQYQDAEMLQLARTRYGMPLALAALLRPCHLASGDWLKLIEEVDHAEMRDKVCRNIPPELLANTDFRRQAVAQRPDFLRHIPGALEVSADGMLKEWGNTLFKAAAHRKLNEFPEAARTRRVCRQRMVIDAKGARDGKQAGGDEWTHVPSNWKAVPKHAGDDCIWLYNCGEDTLRLGDLPEHVQRNPIVIQEYVEAQGLNLEFVDPQWLEAQPHLYEQLCNSAVEEDANFIRHVRGNDLWQYQLWSRAIKSDPHLVSRVGSSQLLSPQRQRLCEELLDDAGIRGGVSEGEWRRIEDRALLELAVEQGELFFASKWMARVPPLKVFDFKVQYYNVCVERELISSFHKIDKECRNRRQSRVIFPRLAKVAAYDRDSAINAIRAQANFLSAGQRGHLASWFDDDPTTRELIEKALEAPKDRKAASSRKRSRSEADPRASSKASLTIAGPVSGPVSVPAPVSVQAPTRVRL